MAVRGGHMYLQHSDGFLHEVPVGLAELGLDLGAPLRLVQQRLDKVLELDEALQHAEGAVPPRLHVGRKQEHRGRVASQLLQLGQLVTEVVAQVGEAVHRPDVLDELLDLHHGEDLGLDDALQQVVGTLAGCVAAGEAGHLQQRLRCNVSRAITLYIPRQLAAVSVVMTSSR